MREAKVVLFAVSWAIGLVSLASAVLHCWSTRHERQPWLLASKIALALSIALSLPYTWGLPLHRYRLIGNVAVYLACAAILASSFAP